MTVLYAPSDFISQDCAISDESPAYWYEGRCPQSGNLLRLPRTRLVEAIAYSLMQHLATEEGYSCEGKMYGVLLVETPSGEQRMLKAFSGLLNGNSMVEGWVPPIPGRDQVALEEACTLAILESIKQDLIALQHIPERQQHETLSREFEAHLQQLALHHRERKQERIHQRQMLLETLSGEALEVALEQLDEQSRRDGIERRQLKRQRNAILQPLKHLIEHADARIHELKQRRRGLSRQLQTQMHANYWLTNFAGESLPLQQLMPGGSIPTGTGECCAPKLLHYAATHDLKPMEHGAIELPLWGDPHDRPYQKVDWQRGKSSVTRFQVIARVGNSTRMDFFPLTGRTHQIRVHAADPRGLGLPILGDRLYGCRADLERLHLHARELRFEHPHSGQIISLRAETPF